MTNPSALPVVWQGADSAAKGPFGASFTSPEVTSLQSLAAVPWTSAQAAAAQALVLSDGKLDLTIARIARTARQAMRQTQQKPSGDPCPIWQPSRAYAVGDRIFPSAYQNAATFTTGFVSALGRLYHLVCVTAGSSSTAEPTWKDPATISNYSLYNTGTGAGQLDIVDGGVTWRLRPCVFIDPTYTGGSNDGSQVRPWINWAAVVATSGVLWGTYALDRAGVGGTDALYAGAMFLQRAGTTITSAASVLSIRGPSGDGVTPDNQTAYSGGTDNALSAIRRLTFGAYRVPGDQRNRAYLVGTGASNTSASGTLTSNNRVNIELQDLDVVNQRPGDYQHGALIYFLPTGGTGFIRWNIRRCNFHDCAGGSGMTIATYDGSSTSPGRNGFYMEDCNFWSNEGHGHQITGNWDNVTTSLNPHGYAFLARRCKAWDNGRNSSNVAFHHGFSAIAIRQSYGNGINTGASGWTLTGGTTYSRGSLTAPTGTLTTVDDVQGVIYRSVSGIWPAILRRNIATPTAPAAGEFGYTSSTLYINLGAVLDVRTQIIVQMAYCRNLRYEYCEAYGNHTYPQGGLTVPNAVEGHGFASDEFSQASWLECFSHDNEQSGLLVHFSDGSEWIGGALLMNWASGAYPSCSVGFRITDADIIGIGSGSGVQSIYGASGTQIENCLIGGVQIGVRRFSDMTAPPLAYPSNTYPWRSTIVGGGNRFDSSVTTPYRVDNVVNGTTAADALMTGDTVVS